jgi:hypothetical protein
MSLYPKAIAKLKEMAGSKGLSRIYDLRLLEKILEHRSLEEYLRFKEDIHFYTDGYLPGFTQLFSDWLNGTISDIDINVYKKRYEEGQHIKYFREYFKDSREEVSRNTKGTLIEFRAYGDSQKINREVIAFEGRFYDDQLTSFNDRTDSADDYIVQTGDMKDDILSNDLSLLTLLIKNACLEVLDNTLTERIICSNLSADLSRLLAEHNHFDRFTQGVIQRTTERKLSAALVRALAEKKRMDVLTQENIHLLFTNDLSEDLIQLFADHDQVKSLSLLSAKDIAQKNLGADLVRILAEKGLLKQFPAETLQQLTKESLDLELLKKLVEYDYLQLVEPTTINNLITDILSDIGKRIGILEQLVSTRSLMNGRGSSEIFIDRNKYLDGMPAKLLQSYASQLKLSDIVAELRDEIQKNYLFSTVYWDQTWTQSMKNKVAALCSADLDKSLHVRLNAIESDAADWVKKQRMQTAVKGVSKVLVYLVIAAAAYYWYQQKGPVSVAPVSEMTSSNSNSGTVKVTYDKPGDYVVAEDVLIAAPIYKDKKKKIKLSARIQSMEKVKIDVVEDSMGFFEAFYDDDFQNIPRGWIEMKNLAPEKGYFISTYGEAYRIRSDQENVIVYKDHLKKNKYKTKLQAMDRLKVYRISNEMAFFKDFYKQTNKLRGWIELSRLEKTE